MATGGGGGALTLGKVLTIPEVASVAGWERKRMWRHLKKMDAELNGRLLKNVGTSEKPKFTVTLAALRQVAPQWFSEAASLTERVEELESQVRLISKDLAMQRSVIEQIVA